MNDTSKKYQESAKYKDAKFFIRYHVTKTDDIFTQKMANFHLDFNMYSYNRWNIPDEIITW